MSQTVDRRAAESRRPLRAPLLGGAAALAAAALLHVRDPHNDGSYGSCPFRVVTGLPCPGCGGLRAVNDLTRGDLAAALGSNALVVALVALTAAMWVVWLVRRARGDASARLLIASTRSAVGLAVVVVAFGVVRWTPWGTWLAP